LPLCEVNIQIVNTQGVVSPWAQPSGGKQLHLGWQFWMLTSLEGNNYLTDSCIDDNSSTLFLKAKKKKPTYFQWKQEELHWFKISLFCREYHIPHLMNIPLYCYCGASCVVIIVCDYQKCKYTYYYSYPNWYLIFLLILQNYINEPKRRIYMSKGDKPTCKISSIGALGFKKKSKIICEAWWVVQNKLNPVFIFKKRIYQLKQ
jgi:hypothetical protein